MQWLERAGGRKRGAVVWDATDKIHAAPHATHTACPLGVQNCHICPNCKNILTPLKWNQSKFKATVFAVWI